MIISEHTEICLNNAGNIVIRQCACDHSVQCVVITPFIADSLCKELLRMRTASLRAVREHEAVECVEGNVNQY